MKLLSLVMALVLSVGVPAQEERLNSVVTEHCLVCGRPVAGAEHVRSLRGRELALCSPPCVVKFEGDPDVYFARLQARGALFQESVEEPRAMGRPWFWFGIYVFLGLVCGAIAGYGAIHRGLSPRTWFFAGLFGNVFAVAAILTRSRSCADTLHAAGIPSGLVKVPTTRPPTRCPSCGHDNHPSASACNACGAALSPTATSEVESA